MDPAPSTAPDPRRPLIDHVVVSGVHSGPNPSSGLGIARSLRAAAPTLRLTGVDYSPRSSGLHSDTFDERVYLPSWGELDPGLWLRQMLDLVGPNGAYIPSLDLEVELIASLGPVDSRVLSLSTPALTTCTKPPSAAAAVMGLPVADSLVAPDTETLESFIHEHSYDVWVKGPNYEATRSHSLSEVLSEARKVEGRWGRGWHVEEHIAGHETSIAFAAVGGELRGAVAMTKLDTTDSGKTWAGAIGPVPDDLMVRLREFVFRSGWTGGGEVETVEDWRGQRLLLEINPRFPAWIHGSTLCGTNLVAALVGISSGSDHPQARPQAVDDTRPGGTAPLHPDAFVRVVHEIPVRSDIALAPQQWKPDEEWSAAGKHPSGMPMLSKRTRPAVTPPRTPSSGYASSAAFARTLTALPNTTITPSRHLDLTNADSRLEALRAALEPAGRTAIALSVKTNPDPALLRWAHAHDLWVDAITSDEADLAARHGFGPTSIVMNGPAKWWPAKPHHSCAAIFADSVTELRDVTQRIDTGHVTIETSVIGIRVSASNLQSRFGQTFETSGLLGEAVGLLHGLCERLDANWGLSFHHSQAGIGTRTWLESAQAALNVVGFFRERLKSTPAIVDIGGGWRARDIDLMGRTVTQLRQRLAGDLDDDTILLVEPGRMLVENAGCVITTVLTRRDDGHVVVDASIAEVPEAPAWPHPVAVQNTSTGIWEPARPGNGMILGRTCMEEDVLANGIDTTDMNEGTRLVIGRTGAYDTSMAYPFGRGSTT